MCGKRRVIYCKERLNRQQLDDINEAQDQLMYTCGSTLFPPGHRQHAVVFVREGLECASDMETSYYAGKSFKYYFYALCCIDLHRKSSMPVDDLYCNV